MTIFDHGAPGVEWSADQADATVPLRPTQQACETYPQTCLACGGDLGVDGYCLQCGQKAKSLREHYELTPATWVAGVCDIGIAHARNEDALACQADAARAVIVVCDGVTTSEDSDVASMAAVRTACDLLWNNNPQGTGTPTSKAAAVLALINQAVIQANQAVIDSTDPASRNSAATTLALAILDGPQIHCANLGDSRVYWLPETGEPVQLSKDHSLAQDGIDSGAGRAEAESSVFAHTITKWLGRDAVDLTAYVTSLEVTSAGWLLVCSDGLWNYASEARAIFALIAPHLDDNPTPLDLATQLVAWANGQGGHDNITVALAHLIPVVPPANTTSDAVSVPLPTSV